MRRSSTWLAALVGLSVMLSGAGCGGDDTPSRTYSVDEVLQAFEAAGYPLVEQGPPAPPGHLVEKMGGINLLNVAVGTDQLADDAWPTYLRQGGDDDSLTIRRANVIAISASGLSSHSLSPAAKKRVRAAMIALPDRGHAVDVLEDR